MNRVLEMNVIVITDLYISVNSFRSLVKVYSLGQVSESKICMSGFNDGREHR